MGIMSSLASWAVLCLVQLATLSSATSTVYIKEADTLFSLNVPPDSEHVNIYMAVPDLYQYVGIGIAGAHSNSLMFIVYPNKDRTGLTLSPRLSSDHTEPKFYEDAIIQLHDDTRAADDTLFLNATCTKGCRTWPGGEIQVDNPGQQMTFAIGQSYWPGTKQNDLDAPLRIHQGHGTFSMDMTLTSSESTLLLPSPDPKTSVGVSFGSDNTQPTIDITRHLREKASTAHGVLFTIIALLIAPLDTLVATALKKWPTLHLVSSVVYFAMVVGAVVPGIQISRRYIATQKLTTPHQVLGLLMFAIMGCWLIFGIVLRFVRKGAAKRGQEVPEKLGLMGRVHRGVGWLVWLLLLVNGGLGLKLAEQGRLFLIGYGSLIGAMIVFMTPLYFLAWRCTRPKKVTQDDGHELYNIYSHEYR